MWKQNPVEVLKLAASTATPLAIALIGLIINRSIQRQNAITRGNLLGSQNGPTIF
jgi:hypothetical protein